MSSQNIEIEFKNMLTKDEYRKLINTFELEESAKKSQENHYFDTKDFLLKSKGCALRIRHKHGSYEMTLKQPYEENLLETNQQLTTAEAEEMIRTGRLLNGKIKKYIEEMNIHPSHLIYFGSLKTDRIEISYKDGILVFDHSFYLNQEDYELEYEVNDRKKGAEIFKELLDNLNIPVRKTENKIKRFYDARYQ
ncbi:CYTH domain-containing protein [Bacillus sp. 03113]|uniref:CYTH domain-containing protein n=1 Tax=Bacillus sp. 03113 TaxID=2578211 RepID=UPI0011416D8B|nr:CYTH domain-containing protein [Bacillus sp. 03113]